MQSVKLRSHVGADGILKLEIPLDLVDTEVEVMIVFQPLSPAASNLEALGWPPDFFEETFGSFQDEPLVRAPQGDYEVRDNLQ